MNRQNKNNWMLNGNLQTNDNKSNTRIMHTCLIYTISHLVETKKGLKKIVLVPKNIQTILVSLRLK